MKVIGNLLWLISGGFISFLGYIIGGVVLCLTVIGIPFGIQVFKLAEVALWPFGKSWELTEGTPGCLSTIMNLIWLVFAGWWIVLVHLFCGLLLAITILGIPWAGQHFKLMSLAVTPFGRRVISK